MTVKYQTFRQKYFTTSDYSSFTKEILHQANFRSSKEKETRIVDTIDISKSRAR